MATVKQHYDTVLSDVYSWMFGGFDAGIEGNERLLKAHRIEPHGSCVAVDLGAGCGFQSIPLANLGFRVVAIDLDSKLLDELARNAKGARIDLIQDDLLNFRQHIDSPAELVVCMQDTLIHLETKHDVRKLFTEVFASLEDGGRFMLSFRDLSTELTDLDRFIPVRSDAERIMTCFLEYEPETVKVHDLVHIKIEGRWELRKSFYRKLRLSAGWVRDELSRAGFREISPTVERGLITIVAQ